MAIYQGFFTYLSSDSDFWRHHREKPLTRVGLHLINVALPCFVFDAISSLCLVINLRDLVQGIASWFLPKDDEACKVWVICGFPVKHSMPLIMLYTSNTWCRWCKYIRL